MVGDSNREKASHAPEWNKANRRPLLSVVTPAFNEEKNLHELHRRFKSVLDNMEIDWEWIVVDDHSTDSTFDVLKGIAGEDDHVRVIRFSRNFGSHMALTCGLNHANGDCAIVMASDLQDPPEEIPRLLAEWKKGAQVVWAVREQREGVSKISRMFSRLYYFLMRHTSALQNLPAAGADFFIIDRKAIEAFGQFREGHVSIIALITWMGFRQTYTTYEKQARLHGKSNWNIKKKLKLVVDSITSFTYFPIRLMSYVGFITAMLGLLYALLIVIRAFSGSPVPGWSSMMAVILVLGGIQMAMLGVLGEYLWRALDESRNRPRYIIEDVLGFHSERGTDIKVHSSDTRSLEDLQR